MIKIYKNDNANSIFIEDSNGAQFPNSLLAVKSSGDTLSIIDLAKNIEIVSSTPYSEFINENNDFYGTDSDSTVNALNVVFTSSGSSSSELPHITSNLNINLTQGETLNYELTSNFGVGYEWDLSNVSGVVTVEGNPRKLVGGSSLSTGTYIIPVKVINYNGEDSKTLTLNVSTPAFANTKSVKFDNLDYLAANATNVNNILGRSGNGSGSSDAWSISMWVKPIGTQNNQTFLYYGGNDNNNEGHIWLRYYGGSVFQGIMLEYGTNNNNLRMLMTNQALPLNQWTHLLITYDGGTTGSSSGNMSTYYSRFKFYANGSSVTTINTHQNFGYNGSIKDERFQVGRKGDSTSYIRSGGRIDELSLWDSDQSSNILTIYNNGTPKDLSSLTQPPNNWWRMGDGDTFPYLQDSGTAANCVFQMYNMTITNIINDVP
jgi:hypothetical protein